MDEGTIDKKTIISNIENQIKRHNFKDIDEFHMFLTNVDIALTDEEKQALENLFNETLKNNEAPIVTTGINYENLLHQLEERIKNNQFKSKEELVDYINKLKGEGIPSSILTEAKITEYLELYDSINVKDMNNLDLSNYAGSKLENQNVIVSKQDDILLKTANTPDQLPEEFKKNQNELTAMNEDGLSNADEVFGYMRDYKKEEMPLITIDEAINRDNIDSETLSKIKYFITNKYVNPYSYRINLENGVFYNMETEDVLEVRKNPETGEYNIYKSGQKVYGDTPEDEEAEKKKDTKEEEMTYEKQKENIKVKRLIKPDLNNNAFVSGGILFIVSLIVALLISLIIIKYK